MLSVKVCIEVSSENGSQDAALIYMFGQLGLGTAAC